VAGIVAAVGVVYGLMRWAAPAAECADPPPGL